MICAQLHLGLLSVLVGVNSHCSDEIVKKSQVAPLNAISSSSNSSTHFEVTELRWGGAVHDLQLLKLTPSRWASDGSASGQEK